MQNSSFVASTLVLGSTAGAKPLGPDVSNRFGNSRAQDHLLLGCWLRAAAAGLLLSPLQGDTGPTSAAMEPRDTSLASLPVGCGRAAVLPAPAVCSLLLPLLPPPATRLPESPLLGAWRCGLPAGACPLSHDTLRWGLPPLLLPPPAAAPSGAHRRWALSPEEALNSRDRLAPVSRLRGGLPSGGLPVAARLCSEEAAAAAEAPSSARRPARKRKIGKFRHRLVRRGICLLQWRRAAQSPCLVINQGFVECLTSPEEGTRRGSPGSGGGDATALSLPLPASHAACKTQPV